MGKPRRASTTSTRLSVRQGSGLSVQVSGLGVWRIRASGVGLSEFRLQDFGFRELV